MRIENIEINFEKFNGTIHKEIDDKIEHKTTIQAVQIKNEIKSEYDYEIKEIKEANKNTNNDNKNLITKALDLMNSLTKKTAPAV